jgi:3-oxoacyl-[acyl-carrier-protein] synthase III
MLPNILLSVAGSGMYLPTGKKNIRDSGIRGPYFDYLISRGVQKVGFAEDELKMAVAAALNALKDAGAKPGDVDLVIYCGSGWNGYRNISSRIVKEISAASAYGFDIDAGLLGGIISLMLANDIMKNSSHKMALIVAAQVHSGSKKDRLVFGDGAGAAVVTKSMASNKILAFNFVQDSFDRMLNEMDGNNSVLNIFSGSYLPKMIEKSIGNLGKTLDACMKNINLDRSDIDHLVKETFSLNEKDMISATQGISPSKIFDRVTDHGHLGCAATLVNLHMLLKAGLVKNLEIIALTATGYDCSAGTMVLRR